MVVEFAPTQNDKTAGNFRRTLKSELRIRFSPFFSTHTFFRVQIKNLTVLGQDTILSTI